MKYSRNDFSFLKNSWTFRYLHGKTTKPNSERDLYRLICSGPKSIFSLLDNKEYAQAANKISYILTLLLDELFNIDCDLQESLHLQQTDRTKAWENWNDSTISFKLDKMPCLDIYFGRQNLQNLFNDGKNNLNNTAKQNLTAVTELLEFIGGLHNIYEANSSNMAPVPVKGPSRTNLKSSEHQDESPFTQDISNPHQKSPTYSNSKKVQEHSQETKNSYRNANLDSVDENLDEIWDNYAQGRYRLALNPIRVTIEDLLKRALLLEKIISPSEVESSSLSKCIDLFENNSNFNSLARSKFVKSELDLV